MKNFQNLDRDEVDDLLPEHLTLVNEELLGHIEQAHEYNQSPVLSKLPRVIEEDSSCKEDDNLELSNNRFSLSENKIANDDSAINM